MAKKDKIEYRVRGIAVHPALFRADTKYNKHGTYKADVRVPLAQAKPMVEQLQERAKSYIGKAMPLKKNSVWYYETTKIDEETGAGGEETGFVVFKVANKNREVTNKQTGAKELWDRKPAIFDGSGKKVSKVPRVGGGTEYAVVFSIYEGKDNDGNKLLSAQIEGVQIYKMVEFQAGGDGRSAADLGFGAEEGGWSAEDEDDADDATSTDTPVEGDEGTAGEAPAGEDDF